MQLQMYIYIYRERERDHSVGATHDQTQLSDEKPMDAEIMQSSCRYLAVFGQLARGQGVFASTRRTVIRKVRVLQTAE